MLEPTSQDSRYSSFDLGNIGFSIYSPNEDNEEQVIGDNIVPVFLVENLETEKQRIEALGCKIVHEQEIGNISLFQFKDTENNILEFYCSNEAGSN